MITTCTVCGQAYDAGSEEQANEPLRLCGRCRGLLRHACGMDSPSPYYRDHFAADPGGEDDFSWLKLSQAGLASVRRQPDDVTPLRIWGVTVAGKMAIGPYDKVIWAREKGVKP